MKKIYLLIILILTLSTLTIAGELDNYLVILHTNDIHGRAEGTNEYWGYAGIKKAKHTLISKGAEVLLFDAGDFTEGTPLVNLSQGINGVEFMNMAKYDAATIGNHEFDWGLTNALNNLKQAEFKVLCANLYKDNKKLFDSNYIFTLKNNIKIGVFGLDTPECTTQVKPSLLEGLEALQGQALYDETQNQIDTLKECELIVCLGHLGDDKVSSPNRSIDVINNTKGIDLFIDGHSHTTIPGGIIEKNNTIRVSTGKFSENIGYVVYKLNDNHYEFIKAGLIEKSDNVLPAIIKQKHIEDTILKKAIENIDKSSLKEISTKIFASKVNLVGSANPGNMTEETNFGDLFADSLLCYGQEVNKECVASIVNGGCIKDSINKGDINTKEILQALPYENTVCIVKIKGELLLIALESSTHLTPAEFGGFPQISGMEITINTQVPFEPGEQYKNSTYFAPKNPGSRVTINSIGGEKFDPNKEYYIATTDFIATGGDTYNAFNKATEFQNTGHLANNTFHDYVINNLNGVIPESYENPKGRITIIK